MAAIGTKPKNAIVVSATSETSDVDPQPEPPECFRQRDHVAELAGTRRI